MSFMLDHFSSLPIDFSEHCRTAAQWTALGFIYEEWSIFPWPPPMRPRMVVEPGYFALAAARNLAAAYHPHRSEP